MVVDCEHVWREISDYLEGELTVEVRAAMEAHFKECQHCRAILDGTRNVVTLYGDDRSFELPAGFDARLRRRLSKEISVARPRSGMVWMLAVAASALIAGSFALAHASSPSQIVLSEQAQPAVGIPRELLVEVSTGGRLYHVPGCKYLQEKPHLRPRSMTAEEAIRSGYAPCVRCLRRYLAQSVVWGNAVGSGELSEHQLWAASRQWP
jgi:Putative zinc-finger